MGKAVSDKTLCSFILIPSFEIPFPRAIDSNSLWCFSSLFACLLAKTTEAVVPAGDAQAEIPVITNGINANKGIAAPSIVTLLLKFEPSSE